MPSLQLLQLTEHGRGLLASKRKALLLATGVIVAGGTAAAYMQSRRTYKEHDSTPCNGLNDSKIEPNKMTVKGSNVKKSRQKKGGLKSVKVLAAILLSRMGKMGTRDLLALIATVKSSSDQK